MTFEKTKHLKSTPRVIFSQECYYPIYDGNKYVNSIKIKPGFTYTNPRKVINTRRKRVVK